MGRDPSMGICNGVVLSTEKHLESLLICTQQNGDAAVRKSSLTACLPRTYHARLCLQFRPFIFPRLNRTDWATASSVQFTFTTRRHRHVIASRGISFCGSDSQVLSTKSAAWYHQLDILNYLNCWRELCYDIKLKYDKVPSLTVGKTLFGTINRILPNMM